MTTTVDNSTNKTMHKTTINGKPIPEPPYKPTNKFVDAVVPFDNIDFCTTFWPVPEGVEVKGRVFFLHGFSECSKVYVKIFDQLVAEGYECFIFDQRGAGWTSPGPMRGHTDEFHVFDDMNFFLKRNLDEVAATHGKLFVGGHSMGGGIALNYGVNGKYKDQIAGIFSTGPLVELHPSTRPGKLLRLASELLMKVWPMKQMDTKLVKEYVTSDEQWRNYVATNPLMFPYIGTLRQLYEMLTRGERLLTKEYADKFDKPLLIIHGNDDKINDKEASAKFIDMAASSDKTLVLVDASRHSCFLEREQPYATVKTALLTWLGAH